MRTWNLGSALTISCLALLTVGAPAGRAQPGSTPAPGPRQAVEPPVLPQVDVTPPAGEVPAVAVPDEKLTLDELIAKLEQVRGQRVALAKQEEALKALARARLKTQEDRLRNVGVLPIVVGPGVGPCVGPAK